jgi:hypothetical protein
MRPLQRSLLRSRTPVVLARGSLRTGFATMEALSVMEALGMMEAHRLAVVMEAASLLHAPYC